MTQCDNTTSECDFKNELCETKESCHKFLDRDLEIKRACYHCRVNIDRNFCKLYTIYEQRSSHVELNELIEEINNRKKEVVYLQERVNSLEIQKESKQKEVTDLNEEIGLLNNEAIKIRTNDFLRATIGGENYLFYIDNGYLDVIGTNGSVYRITNRGKISKMEIKKGLVNRIENFVTALKIFLKNYRQKGDIEEWQGKIKTSNHPLEDSIAIIYVNIMKDSDRFDRDKACGNIYTDYK